MLHWILVARRVTIADQLNQVMREIPVKETPTGHDWDARLPPGVNNTRARLYHKEEEKFAADHHQQKSRQ
eukprot:129278-Pyramimonas_sp.AAC.1